MQRRHLKPEYDFFNLYIKLKIFLELANAHNRDNEGEILVLDCYYSHWNVKKNYSLLMLLSRYEHQCATLLAMFFSWLHVTEILCLTCFGGCQGMTHGCPLPFCHLPEHMLPTSLRYSPTHLGSNTFFILQVSSNSLYTEDLEGFDPSIPLIYTFRVFYPLSFVTEGKKH